MSLKDPGLDEPGWEQLSFELDDQISLEARAEAAGFNIGSVQRYAGMRMPGNSRLRTPEENSRWLDLLEWSMFYQEALTETIGQGPDRPTRSGPLTECLTGILAETDRGLKELDPVFTPEFLMPANYRSPEVNQYLSDILKENAGMASRLGLVRSLRTEAIDKMFDGLYPGIRTQTIPFGLLDEPDYAKQRSHRDCTTTAFEMVANTLLGRELNGGLMEALRNVHKTETVHDEVYLAMLKSKTLERQTGVSVDTISYFGADFKCIGELARKVKQRMPGAQVYCLITLLSPNWENAKQGIWHTNVVLGVTSDTVVVHDPRHTDAMQYDKEELARRWAHAYGRAHLVVAQRDEDLTQ